MTIRAFSYGGGVQSTAALVLAAQGKIDFPTFLFCNVGADSENPLTLEYVNTHAKPYAEAHGIQLIELDRRKRDGSLETIYGRLTKPGSRSLPIPIRMSNGAPGQRACTVDFKIKVVAKWLKAHGAKPDWPAITGLGISTDEWHRAKTDSRIAWQVLEYPLLDLRLSRRDCMRIIETAGLPIPPKSSCYFCPFHSPTEWRRLKHEQLELFDKSVELERMLNDRRATLGKDPVWMTRFNMPLDHVVAGDQSTLDDALDDMDNCESGYCMT